MCTLSPNRQLDSTRRGGAPRGRCSGQVQLTAVDVISQLRATLRAGAVPERVVLAAAGNKVERAIDSILQAGSALFDGSIAFVKTSNGRRSMCATISHDCDDFSTDLLRRFISGGYTLGQVDADAHTRVVYGKCRGAYLSDESTLRHSFTSALGALGAHGFARAARGTHPISADDPPSYALIKQYMRITDAQAKLVVGLAGAIAATETHFRGAIVVTPESLEQEAVIDGGSEGADALQSPIVWLQDGKVARLQSGIYDEKMLGALTKEYTKLYGAGDSKGTNTEWHLPGGTARLDVGAAAMLTVESPVMNQAPAAVGTQPPAPSASSSAVPNSNTHGTAANRAP